MEPGWWSGMEQNLTKWMRVCSVKIINTNDMSMGPLNKHSPAGGHAKRISRNSIGQAKRPVLADYLTYAFSVRTT